MHAGGDAAFKNDVDVRVVVVQMLCKPHGILDDFGRVELGNEQDVPGILLPVESEEAYGGFVI